MKKTVFKVGKLAAILSVLLLGLDAAAQTVTPATSIVRVRTGWISDAVALETTETAAGSPSNPANCPVADAYMTDSSVPGYKNYMMAIMTAFATEKKVKVVISNTDCLLNRPKIWGIYIEQ